MTCTGYLCNDCYKKYDPNSYTNIIKSVANCRTENENPICSTAKGRVGEKLLCMMKGYIDLNQRDGHGCPIDCQDPVTKDYYQVKLAHYDSEYDFWHQNFKRLQESIKKGNRFKSVYLFCMSKDRKIVERMYEIPEKEIFDIEQKVGKESISIYKNPSRGTSWYEKYRIYDEIELKKANDIFQTLKSNTEEK